MSRCPKTTKTYVSGLTRGLLCGLALMLAATAVRGEEAPLWTQTPVRIDRAKQSYERLPAVKVARDDRVWIFVSERIRMIDSGAFEFGGRQYRLTQIHPIQAKRLCKAVDGGRWPCGRLSVVFLGNLVRGKRLLCEVDATDKVVKLSNCAVGKRDIATEIVTQGFGKAIGPQTLLTTEMDAQSRAVKGMWRNSACIADFDHC